jgi:hypothetical protein
MQQFEIYEQRIPYLDLNDGKNRPLLIMGEIRDQQIRGYAIYRKKTFWKDIPGIMDLMYHPYDTRLENLHRDSHVDISRRHKFAIDDFDTKTPKGSFTERDVTGIYYKIDRLRTLKKICSTQNPERIFDFLTLRDLYIHDQPIPGI